MKLIANFHHTPGIHCGSTALMDQLQHLGFTASEEMCFGLGSGLAYTYLRNPNGASPSRIHYGRTRTLERDLCRHLGLAFVEGDDEDPEHAWQVTKEFIDADIPVLLHVELSRLPYWHARIPFPGHRVLAAGYDDDRRIAFLADTDFPGLQEVPYEALRAARTAQVPPIPLHNDWLAIRPDARPLPLEEAIPAALRDNALGMDLDRALYQGIMGMESLAEEFESWADLPDWRFCALVAYQNIEVRGTGGGMFRKIYGRYLREAEQIVPSLREAKLAEMMEELAVEWTALGDILQRISKDKDRVLFKDASRSIRRLAMREESFWGRVLNTVGRE